MIAVVGWRPSDHFTSGKARVRMRHGNKVTFTLKVLSSRDLKELTSRLATNAILTTRLKAAYETGR